MNAVDVGAWNANWAWSLPLIEILRSAVQEVDAPVVSCLFHQSLSEWHLQGAGDSPLGPASAV
jgi:hypothetical protein